MVRDRLADEVRQESLCLVMFAGDILIRSESRGQVVDNLERLQRRRLKVSHVSTVQSNGEYGKGFKWVGKSIGNNLGKKFTRG